MAGLQTVAMDWDRLGQQPKPRGGQNSDRPLALPRIDRCVHVLVCVTVSLSALPWLLPFLLMIKMFRCIVERWDVFYEVPVFVCICVCVKTLACEDNNMLTCDYACLYLQSYHSALWPWHAATLLTKFERKLTFPPGNVGNTQFRGHILNIHATLRCLMQSYRWIIETDKWRQKEWFTITVYPMLYYIWCCGIRMNTTLGMVINDYACS